MGQRLPDFRQKGLKDQRDIKDQRDFKRLGGAGIGYGTWQTARSTHRFRF